MYAILTTTTRQGVTQRRHGTPYEYMLDAVTELNGLYAKSKMLDPVHGTRTQKIDDDSFICTKDGLLTYCKIVKR